VGENAILLRDSNKMGLLYTEFEKKGQAAGDGHYDTSSLHVHVGLARLHAHGYALTPPLS
jgi:hypothetical protein